MDERDDDQLLLVPNAGTSLQTSVLRAIYQSLSWSATPSNARPCSGCLGTKAKPHQSLSEMRLLHVVGWTSLTWRLRVGTLRVSAVLRESQRDTDCRNRNRSIISRRADGDLVSGLSRKRWVTTISILAFALLTSCACLGLTLKQMTSITPDTIVPLGPGVANSNMVFLSCQ